MWNVHSSPWEIIYEWWAICVCSTAPKIETQFISIRILISSIFGRITSFSTVVFLRPVTFPSRCVSRCVSRCARRMPQGLPSWKTRRAKNGRVAGSSWLREWLLNSSQIILLLDYIGEYHNPLGEFLNPDQPTSSFFFRTPINFVNERWGNLWWLMWWQLTWLLSERLIWRKPRVYPPKFTHKVRPCDALCFWFSTPSSPTTGFVKRPFFEGFHEDYGLILSNCSDVGQVDVK